jgi:pimeloyl-ACP methyl ester carboxylesterase
MQVLAKAGFQAIAIDLPPFGFSQRPADADYSKSAQGAHIVGVLDALNIRNAILVGHSFGGGPTMEAVLQIPQRVKGIAAISA